tara:strand:- start:1367 stop:3313 length:1947 start_codon:yes stop_codon:yes gene_type:complete
MAETMTSASASQILQAIKVLEVLEANGTISAGEQAALDRARAKQKPAEQAALETRATYGGFTAGAMMNLNDEARGAYNFANKLLKSGDMEGAKKAYAKYRDLQRQIDQALQVVAPEQYASGQTAGAVTSMVAPGGIAFKAGSKLPVLGQIATSSGVGATATALPQFAGGEDGFTARMSEVDPLTTAVGATLGAVAPVAGRMVGAVTRGAQNLSRKGVDGYGGAASRRVASTLSGPQATGQDIQSYLDSLGPEAMLADVPGRPRTMAQGLATIPGEGQEVLTREIGARGAGSGQRIEDVMTQRIDQPNVGFEETLAQQQRKSGVLGPMYEAATQSDKTFDVDTLRSALVLYGKDASRSVRAQMNAVLKDLGTTGAISAEKMHNVRSALSDVIFKEGGSVAVNLKPFLHKMDDQLDELPTYAAARSGYSEASAIQRAVEDGEKVFTGGKTSALSPRELETKLANMTDMERAAFQKGARDYIGALMGTSRNDASAAWGEFSKSWNAEKLKMLVGDADAQAITQRLLAEKEFSKTSSDVLAGSQTGFRSEAAAGLRDLRDPDSLAAPSVGQRVKAGLSAPVNRIMDEIMYGTGNIRREIGEILTLQGPERDAVVAQLLGEASKLQDKTKLQNLTNMLTQVGLMASTPAITGE